MILKTVAENPLDDEPSPAASLAEHAARQASAQDITPQEKQAIATETSRQEDA